MAELPVLFTEYTRQLMGEERFERYLQSFEEDVPVSIRLNPRKSGEWKVESGERIDWCRNGYYLKQRPNFTFDPLFHAGCYYVQEAASTFSSRMLARWRTGSLEYNTQLSGNAERSRVDFPPGAAQKSIDN